jgi:hypothetical protein
MEKLEKEKKVEKILFCLFYFALLWLVLFDICACLFCLAF